LILTVPETSTELSGIKVFIAAMNDAAFEHAYVKVQPSSTSWSFQ
jgi:hypothetical protein